MRFFSAHSVWRLPVASKTVTVTTNNDKTGYTVSTNSDKSGYSLTAGSYSIRASSVQRGTMTITGTEGTNTATITGVTTTRSYLSWLCHTLDNGTSGWDGDFVCRVSTVSSTEVRMHRGTTTDLSVSNLVGGFEIIELF